MRKIGTSLLLIAALGLAYFYAEEQRPQPAADAFSETGAAV